MHEFEGFSQPQSRLRAFFDEGHPVLVIGVLLAFALLFSIVLSLIFCRGGCEAERYRVWTEGSATPIECTFKSSGHCGINLHKCSDGLDRTCMANLKYERIR